jgi:hypothetical protein
MVSIASRRIYTRAESSRSAVPRPHRVVTEAAQGSGNAARASQSEQPDGRIAQIGQRQRPVAGMRQAGVFTEGDLVDDVEPVSRCQRSRLNGCSRAGGLC